MHTHIDLYHISLYLTVQGATDVDVACCVYEAAGAFSAERAVDAIIYIYFI